MFPTNPIEYSRQRNRMPNKFLVRQGPFQRTELSKAPWYLQAGLKTTKGGALGSRCGRQIRKSHYVINIHHLDEAE